MLKVVGASWFQTVISFLIVVGILLFGILINIICRTQNHEDDGKYSATVFWNPETEQFDIELLGQNHDPKSISRGIARAYYQPDMKENGWAILEIDTNSAYSDADQAFAAGILEEQNTATIRKKARANDKYDPFWHQVNLFYMQLDGMEFGWRYEVRRNKQSYEIPFLDFLWLNIASDLKDFQKIAFPSNNSYNHSPAAMTLLKLLLGNDTKFLLAHASSGFYSSMLRVQKKYNFNYHLTGRSNAELVPGRTISFTSYPGAIHSQDDFYQILVNDGSTVTVTGTALLTLNWKDEGKKTDYQVLLGPRIMAGNRLSRNGKTWAYNVGRHQSGTGNKQWLHIHTKNDRIILWVLEQTPQRIINKNETELLYNQGYWISCGIPYYKRSTDIKIDSGEISQHNAGNVPLKNILEVLRQGQQNVTDIDSLINLMRGPELVLAGRTDLHDSIISYSPTDSTSSNGKPNESSTKNSSQANKSSALPLRIQNSMKLSNADVNVKRNFNVIYNSSWLNLFTLKNDILLTSPPEEKRSLENVQPNVRHDKIVGSQRVENEPKINTVHRTKRITDETNSNNNPSGSKLPLITIDGVIDLKLTDTNDKFLAVAGPPFNLQNKLRTIEPFQWSKSPINYLPHDGQADIWKYEPVEANFVWD
ncbi:putative phospholipase B-like 2 isoform X2 [Planococcus citri]|uniref:putative phospholipase B-like 2 isoform X2 n=1 Tax=Planococcus citri TaxID=170843 RepID=UPI0031F92A8E